MAWKKLLPGYPSSFSVMFYCTLIMKILNTSQRSTDHLDVVENSILLFCVARNHLSEGRLNLISSESKSYFLVSFS